MDNDPSFVTSPALLRYLRQLHQPYGRWIKQCTAGGVDLAGRRAQVQAICTMYNLLTLVLAMDNQALVMPKDCCALMPFSVVQMLIQMNPVPCSVSRQYVRTTLNGCKQPRRSGRLQMVRPWHNKQNAGAPVPGDSTAAPGSSALGGAGSKQGKATWQDQAAWIWLVWTLALVTLLMIIGRTFVSGRCCCRDIWCGFVSVFYPAEYLQDADTELVLLSCARIRPLLEVMICTAQYIGNQRVHTCPCRPWHGGDWATRL